MLAQITLTPTESKKLIGMAVGSMPEVKQAASAGMAVLHPSSSTYFVAEELLGRKPETNVWVCGVVAPKGTCVEIGTAIGPHPIVSEKPEESAVTGSPEAFRLSWVIRKGELHTGISLGSLLQEMGPGDVYIKGVNALDPNMKVGVLVGSLVEGGTIGRVMVAVRRKGFTVIFPVGLEKLIPVSIKEAAKGALKTQYEYSMGIACGLFPCQDGIVVTEIEAIRILSDCQAMPIAAGGLGGAEGAITLVLKGEKELVKRAIEYAETAKGAKLPQVRTFNCLDCHQPMCQFPLGDKHWVL